MMSTSKPSNKIGNLDVRITEIIKNNILLREAYVRKHSEFKRAHELIRKLYEHYTVLKGDNANEHLKKLMDYFDSADVNDDENMVARTLYQENETLKQMYSTEQEFLKAYRELNISDDNKSLKQMQEVQTNWDNDHKTKSQEINILTRREKRPLLFDIPLKERFVPKIVDSSNSTNG